LIESDHFEVQAGETAEMQPYVSSFFRFPLGRTDNDSVLSGLIILWYGQHPDMEFLEQGEFFLSGLANASFVPVSYTDENGIGMAAYLVGMVHKGTGHLLVLQAPLDEFSQI